MGLANMVPAGMPLRLQTRRAAGSIESSNRKTITLARFLKPSGSSEKSGFLDELSLVGELLSSEESLCRDWLGSADAGQFVSGVSEVSEVSGVSGGAGGSHSARLSEGKWVPVWLNGLDGWQGWHG
jgi:hypothetical protein